MKVNRVKPFLPRKPYNQLSRRQKNNRTLQNRIRRRASYDLVSTVSRFQNKYVSEPTLAKVYKIQSEEKEPPTKEIVDFDQQLDAEGTLPITT